MISFSVADLPPSPRSCCCQHSLLLLRRKLLMLYLHSRFSHPSTATFPKSIAAGLELQQLGTLPIVNENDAHLMEADAVGDTRQTCVPDSALDWWHHVPRFAHRRAYPTGSVTLETKYVHRSTGRAGTSHPAPSFSLSLSSPFFNLATFILSSP